MRTKLGYAAMLAVFAASAIAFAGPSGGSISGKVTYEGTPARQKPIDMSKEPACAQQHPTPITTETVVVGPGNTLANVVVYVSAGAPDDTTPPAQAVTITQKGCQYLPHVVPMVVNQELKVVNADSNSHNIHPLAKINNEWNKSQPPGTPPSSEIRQAGVHPREVQHSSLDAQLVRSAQEFPLRCFWRGWWLLAPEPAGGEVHGDCVA
jgi:hypothetical protein